VRATCASALLQFLLDYPLGPKRTAAHMSFLATNLGFEYEAGRLAVLDMLQQVRVYVWLCVACVHLCVCMCVHMRTCSRVAHCVAALGRALARAWAAVGVLWA